MSVLDDFVRMRLYRKRAAEFQWLADNATIATVQRRCRTIARHYSELADREEQADKARMAERIERLRLQRQQAAPKATLPATSDTQFFLIAAE
jgi:hypothetical protein